MHISCTHHTTQYSMNDQWIDDTWSYCFCTEQSRKTLLIWYKNTTSFFVFNRNTTRLNEAEVTSSSMLTLRSVMVYHFTWSRLKSIRFHSGGACNLVDGWIVTEETEEPICTTECLVAFATHLELDGCVVWGARAIWRRIGIGIVCALCFDKHAPTFY